MESDPVPPKPLRRSRNRAASSSARVAALREAQASVVRPERTPISIAFASGTAIVSALVWAAVIAEMGIELGVVAWGVGAAVGISAVAAGGRGKLVAGLAGALALFAIAGGKYLGTRWSIESYVEEQADLELTEENYAGQLAWAEPVANLDLNDRAAVVRFLERSGWDRDGRPDLSVTEIESFLSEHAAPLARLHREQQSFEQWRADRRGPTAERIRADFDPTAFITDSLGLTDLVFAGLGIASAIGIVLRKTQEAEAAARRRVLQAHRES